MAGLLLFKITSNHLIEGLEPTNQHSKAAFKKPTGFRAGIYCSVVTFNSCLFQDNRGRESRNRSTPAHYIHIHTHTHMGTHTHTYIYTHADIMLSALFVYIYNIYIYIDII